MQLLNNIAFFLRSSFPWLCISILVLAAIIPLLSTLNFYSYNFANQFSDYYLRITYFSLLQATLSSIISVILGIVLAHLLFKHRYIHGIYYLINSLGVVFVLPTILIVLGIVSIYGSLEFLSLYGLFGILIAHITLNIPFVSRILFQSLSDISSSEWMLAKHVNLDGLGLFKVVEWPIIKKNIPSLFLIVFFICFVSFIPVLVLGGGPKFSTLEVAIYQSIIFDFNFDKGLNLLFIQLAICLFLFVAIFSNFKSKNFILNENREFQLLNNYSIKYFFEYMVMFAVLIFIFSPILIIIVNGFSMLLDVLIAPYFWKSLLTTFYISFFSGLLSIVLIYGSLLFINTKNKTGEIYLYALIIISPAIMSVGYYIFLNNYIPFKIANIYIVIFLNAVFTLPFAYNFLAPSFFRMIQEHSELSKSIGIVGLRKFMFVDWPRLKEPIVSAFCVASILSASDLVIISFFGTNSLSTLTQTIYRLMGSYRVEESQAVALLLLIYCFIYFIVSYKLVLKKWDTQ